MDNVLTLEQVRNSARKIVAVRGRDFRYMTRAEYDSGNLPVCAYVPSTDERFPYRKDLATGASRETGCLVGEILKELGALTDTVAQSTDPIDSLVRQGDVPATSEARTFLRELQSAQDRASTWGDALDTAEALVR